MAGTSSPVADAAQTRRHPRAPVDVFLTARGRRGPIPVHLCDISLGGALIASDLRHSGLLGAAPSEQVELESHIDGTPVRAVRVRVVRTSHEPEQLEVLAGQFLHVPGSLHRAIHRLQQRFAAGLDGHVRRRVLLVDRSVARRQVLSSRLRLLGYEVLHAAGPLQALWILESSFVDAILVSERLGGVEGTDLLSHLRETFSTLRRAVLADQSRDAERLPHSNAHTLLTSPWDLFALQDAVAHILST